jgi:hypothetical protein
MERYNQDGEARPGTQVPRFSLWEGAVATAK